MAQDDKRPSIGIDAAITGAGLGIPLLLWVLVELKVHLPKLVLYLLLVVSGLMIAGPWIVLVIRRTRRPKAQPEDVETRTQPLRWNPSSLFPRGHALMAATKKLEESRDLKELLREGLRLQGILDAQEDSKPPHKDDPVCHWARATWVALQHQRPLVAKEFFGGKSPYGSPYFATAYGIEVDRLGRRAYLAGRITLLAEVVEPRSPVGHENSMGNIDRMNLIATKQAEAAAEHVARESEHRVMLGKPALPDTLASLYSAFRELRDKVKPERVPAYKLVLRPIRTPSVAALEQREAQRLDGAVRQALTEQAPRFVPDWDEAASLPPNDELMPGVPVFTADAKKIAEFLDAKMVVLRRIIAELREGR
jgi:hypothetical protein